MQKLITKNVTPIPDKVELDKDYLEFKEFMGFTEDDMIEDLKKRGITSIYIRDLEVEGVTIK